MMPVKGNGQIHGLTPKSYFSGNAHLLISQKSRNASAKPPNGERATARQDDTPNGGAKRWSFFYRPRIRLLEDER